MAWSLWFLFWLPVISFVGSSMIIIVHPFDRDGRLLEIAIDQRTRRQFLQMLSKTDLHP